VARPSANVTSAPARQHEPAVVHGPAIAVGCAPVLMFGSSPRRECLGRAQMTPWTVGKDAHLASDLRVGPKALTDTRDDCCGVISLPYQPPLFLLKVGSHAAAWVGDAATVDHLA
jgi:hypothetical protein